MPRLWWLAATVICVCGVCVRAGEPPTDVPTTEAADGDEPMSRREINKRLVAFFERKDYAGALKLLDDAIKHRPNDFLLYYNRACSLAMLSKQKEAAETLVKAVSLGFVDFDEMERDEHIAPLRTSDDYRAIIKGWRELIDARGDSNEQVTREYFGTSYTYERDMKLRLIYASAMEAGSFDAAKKEITRVAEWAQRELWPNEKENPERPQAWVSVVLPTPKDFFGIIRTAGVGGIYDRDSKRLVAQDIGPTLRHEFFHVLHWRHQSRLGQRHPLWVMEGLAGLVEEMDPQGTMLPSWRTNMAKRLERRGGLMKLDQFVRLTDERFMRPRPRATYAQARTVFLFMESRGVLGTWYSAYTAGFADDPTGAHAMESAFGARMPEIDKQFREWLRELPDVAEQSRPGDATLGAVMSAGAGDGPVVNSVVTVVREGDRLDGERLRRRDIVEAIDDKPTRNIDDLLRVLGEYDVGDEVKVSIRRGTRRLDIRIRLVPVGEASGVLP